MRGRLQGDRVVDLQEIFEANAWGGNNNHFSGRMVFDRSGYLFLAVGDRMVTPDLMDEHPAQDLTNHMGTIIRLHDDGRVPSDNPFVGRADALPEIWSYGHRNIQGLALHPLTGEVWLNEHGPRGGDELNLIVRGANYGWPVVSYGIHYDGSVFTTETERRGMRSPRFARIPSIGISGLMFYSAEQFPWWKGNVFVGGLAGERLDRVSLLNGRTAVSRETLLEGVLGRIRDVRQGPDGFIYLSIEHPEEAGRRTSSGWSRWRARCSLPSKNKWSASRAMPDKSRRARRERFERVAQNVERSRGGNFLGKRVRRARIDDRERRTQAPRGNSRLRLHRNEIEDRDSRVLATRAGRRGTGDVGFQSSGHSLAVADRRVDVTESFAPLGFLVLTSRSSMAAFHRSCKKGTGVTGM